METQILHKQTEQTKSSEAWKNLIKFQRELEETGVIYLETEEPNFNWIKFCTNITQSDLILQYNQEVIFKVKFKLEFAKYSDAKSQNELLPHTESSDYVTPPKYLALWCEQPSNCGGGATTLASVEGFLRQLTEEEQKKLMETICFFGARSGIHQNRTKGVFAPILLFNRNKPNFRFSYNLLKYGDYSPNNDQLDQLEKFIPNPFIAEIADKFLNYYQENNMGIVMKKYSLLLWNNQTMVHSRTAYKDPNRELHRIFLG